MSDAYNLDYISDLEKKKLDLFKNVPMSTPASVQPVQMDYFTDGTSEQFARSDHQHPLSKQILDLLNGIGSSTIYVKKSGDTMSGGITFVNSSSVVIGGFAYNGGTGFVNGAGHPAHGTSYATLYRADMSGAGQYAILNSTTALFLNAPAAGTLYLRNGNNDVASVTSGSLNVLGSLPLQWPSWGGGWYMSDVTWIRSYNGKAVYCSALLGCGTLSVNLAGAITSGWSADIGGASSLYCRGIIRSDNYVQAVKTDGVVWNTAQIQAYSNGNYVQMSWYQNVGGAAPQQRNHSSEGYRLTAVNSDQSGYSNYKAGAFEVASSIDYKLNVHSLSPEIEPRFAFVEWDEDTIEYVDIMALRPVVYRKQGFPQKIVPAPGYTEVDSMDLEHTSQIVENFDYIWQTEHYRERLGLIAEEVARVIPSCIQFRWPDAKPDAIDYAQITVALLDHVQRLTRQVETLQYRVIELESV